MAPDEQKQPTQDDHDGQVAAELAALSARVEMLERQVAELHGQPSVDFRQATAAPPPVPIPAPENLQSSVAGRLPKVKGSLEKASSWNDILGISQQTIKKFSDYLQS